MKFFVVGFEGFVVALGVSREGRFRVGVSRFLGGRGFKLSREAGGREAERK